jgi:hypothetical protein
MGNPRTKGRMITKDISNSRKFAALSPEAAVLFAMLIPHYNSHGKMNGGAGYIKDEVCPFVSYLTIHNISKLLKEISDKTNVKWFEFEGRMWLHSLKWHIEHQILNPDRLGPDSLPTYSGLSPSEDKDKDKGQAEGEVEDKVKSHNGEPLRLAELLLSLIRSRSSTFKQPNIQKWASHIDLMLRLDKREVSHVETVIRWCQMDSFWQNNILSTEKLRKQFDQLELKANGRNAKSGGNRELVFPVDSQSQVVS